ncbi:acyltransferase domain-containing protein [Motilimonas sp. 1_MG-2023]|uniref:acyltransferase domain-containing protein n=1 Tax=Motilimonas sp. 1_MG-2023 TaxID=3062672 RepID=UPI0026E36337|nr:acyltransferase domain-containing protein [Motilimonas sp. 1_MG-2023]MDO6526360.1 acyltransferase domain-containing protein [Motilimonas sp. 1_MG-2023]
MGQPIVFMFSGQGSQYFQMGRELYENNSRFHLWMNHCSQIVEDLIGESLIDIIYYRNGKGDPFERILYSNPALLSIEYCLARILIEKKIEPDYLLGYSMGEMTAAVVSESLTLEEGLTLAVDVAKILEEGSPAGAMLAIIENENIVYRYPDAFRCCAVSGRNFDNHFVVSGLLDDVIALQSFLEAKNVLTHKLAVNHGFHSSVLESVSEKCKALCGSLDLRSPKYPIYSCVESAIIKEYSVEHFWRVIREPVDFVETISQIEKRGSHIYIDVGPSGTLSTFIYYLLGQDSFSKRFEAMNQFGKDIQLLTYLESKQRPTLIK